jgi:3',5'-cyclic AMP phosphodiesterase CpdA
MKLAWLTDIHLNFVHPERLEAFFENLSATAPDAVVISGDIGEAPDVAWRLRDLATRLGCPIYFVLGNHDFYRGSFAGVREKIKATCSAVPNIKYLSTSNSVIQLTERTGLLGHDGWGDARLGTPHGWKVALNDWEFIQDLRNLSEKELLRKLNALGDDAAAHFRAILPEAIERFPELLVVTHVPPFREACWHQGRISDDDWLPHFTCKAVGDVLREAMAAHPDSKMTVLCGHTHGGGEAHILPNLRVLTGEAAYGRPAVQRIMNFF